MCVPTCIVKYFPRTQHYDQNAKYEVLYTPRYEAVLVHYYSILQPYFNHLLVGLNLVVSIVLGTRLSHNSTI